MTDAAVDIRNISKRYAGHVAVRVVLHHRIAVAFKATRFDFFRGSARETEHRATFRFTQMLLPGPMTLLAAAIVVVRGCGHGSVFRSVA